MPTAIITGITGQDGSFLSELLLEKGYNVHGIIRRSSNFNTQRIDHIYNNPNLKLHYGDLHDSLSIFSLINEIKPDEIYNLGAQSHVRVSYDIPEYTFDVVALGPVRILESIRKINPEIKFYQASSSEMYGSNYLGKPQNENTRFHPRSPYGCAKVAAYHTTINYRESYGVHASNGILFNHESERRGETFVTRKVTRAAARIKIGIQDKLFLGNLDAKRDWGYAKDHVEAMWMMLQQNNSGDYVIATGEIWSIRDLLGRAFEHVGLDWNKYVELDPKYYRPAEVDILHGDSTKAKTILKWEPRTSFDDMVKIMMNHDLKLAEQEKNYGKTF
jgi:GDPmannose 4,6-dehydratase